MQEKEAGTKPQNTNIVKEDSAKGDVPPKKAEIGGPKGPEPTRYGDWEKGGRCTDF